jgi:hypothetical protein
MDVVTVLSRAPAGAAVPVNQFGSAFSRGDAYASEHAMFGMSTLPDAAASLRGLTDVERAGLPLCGGGAEHA